jgi:hypothetical protein
MFYSFFNYIGGDTGINAMREMELRKKRLENNLLELNSINQQLNEDLLSLGRDPERIAIQSRNLGFIQNHEKMVFVNLGKEGSEQLDVGKILYMDKLEGSNSNMIKWMALIIFSLGQIINIFSLKRSNS